MLSEVIIVFDSSIPCRNAIRLNMFRPCSQPYLYTHTTNSITSCGSQTLVMNTNAIFVQTKIYWNLLSSSVHNPLFMYTFRIIIWLLTNDENDTLSQQNLNQFARSNLFSSKICDGKWNVWWAELLISNLEF